MQDEAGSDHVKKISGKKLNYYRFEHSDWLNKNQQIIILIKTKIGPFLIFKN